MQVAYYTLMHKAFSFSAKESLPLVIERDEDGVFVIECPLFSGCYTQGKTLNEALANILEVIALCSCDIIAAKRYHHCWCK